MSLVPGPLSSSEKHCVACPFKTVPCLPFGRVRGVALTTPLPPFRNEMKKCMRKHSQPIAKGVVSAGRTRLGCPLAKGRWRRGGRHRQWLLHVRNPSENRANAHEIPPSQVAES